MAILTHGRYGNCALEFRTEETGKTKANITPMRLLVQHMTGVASCVCMCPCVLS